MTTEQIHQKFNEVLQTKGLSKKIENYSKDVVYNWRFNRGRKPTTGEMLDVLYQLDLITIKENEPNRIQKRNFQSNIGIPVYK